AATCNTVNFSIVVTVRPTLTASLANPATICSGAAVAAVSPTSNIAGTTYTWTLGAITGGVTGAAAQATAQAQFSTGNLSNAGAVDGTVTYNITATNAATCNTVDFSISVTIHPVISIDPVADDEVCHNETVPAISFTSTLATSYTWTNSNTSIGLAASGTGNIASFTATNTGSTPVTATIVVTPYINGCPGNTETFTIIVNPIITMNPVADDEVCHNETLPAISFT
ncbi:MAG: hypothetical protein CFE22_14450, partial [Cytophagaceae bacterium BCCC1]